MVTEAPYPSLYDPGQVRCAELVMRVLALEADDLDASATELSILDLFGGLERVSLLPMGPVQSTLLGYLNEYYGLLGVGRDPFLRPLLPPVPSTGATVRRHVLAINGKVLRMNGAALGIGADLVLLAAQEPAQEPVAGNVVVTPVSAAPTAGTAPAPRRTKP